jgi:hypothetical protein
MFFPSLMLFLIKVEEISTMGRQLNVLLGDFLNLSFPTDESTWPVRSLASMRGHRSHDFAK